MSRAGKAKILGRAEENATVEIQKMLIAVMGQYCWEGLWHSGIIKEQAERPGDSNSILGRMAWSYTCSISI